MNVDAVIKETARDATAEADRVAANEAAKDTQEEATKESAERAGKETGDHTDGIPTTGVLGATPVIEPPAAGEASVEDQPSTSGAPPSGKYLKVGNNLFVSIPGTASIGVPTEGETFDEDIIAAAGLEIVDEPSASSGQSEEEKLLQAMNSNFQKLHTLHHARKEKLDSRAVVVEAAEADFQKCVEETQT